MESEILPHFKSRSAVTAQRLPATKLRAPRTKEPNRVCEHPDCCTKLSIYNRQSMCHVHKKIRFPRVRGRQPKGRP